MRGEHYCSAGEYHVSMANGLTKHWETRLLMVKATETPSRWGFVTHWDCC